MMNKPQPKNFLSFLLALVFLLTACTGPAEQISPVSDTPTPPDHGAAAEPSASPTPSLPTEMETVRLSAANILGLTPENIQIQTYSDIDWPDSCLGLPLPEEMCAQAITPGYSGILQVGEEQFELHSDRSGQRVRLIPEAALAARQALAQQIGISPEEIMFGIVEAVDWPDECLGIQAQDQQCTQVITPGYRIPLSANGKLYEYHTNRLGSILLSANIPLAKGTDILWEQTTGDNCETASISAGKVISGVCGAELTPGQLASPQRKTELSEWIGLFAPFEADTPAGKIQFSGQGPITATPMQQRAIAAWVRQIKSETAENNLTPEKPIIAWHRDGGGDNLCQDVSIYTYGKALVSSCQNGANQELKHLLLSDGQLQNLYTWLDQFASFEVKRVQSFGGGRLSSVLTFVGMGQSSDKKYQKDIEYLAKEILSIATLDNPNDLLAARQVLNDYLKALNDGRYADAAVLYGGEYKTLREYNPDISKKDVGALFEAACTKNGFICNLLIKNEVSAVQISETEFRFSLEMQPPGGSLFTLIVEQSTVTQFDFIVTRIKDHLVVTSLPIYAP